MFKDWKAHVTHVKKSFGALGTAIALNAGAAYTYALRALEAYQVNQNP